MREFGEVVHIAGEQEAKLLRFFGDHPIDGKQGEIIRPPRLQRYLVLADQLLQRLPGFDETGHVVLAKWPHLAQLHREGVGAVLVGAVVAEGGGRAGGEQYGAHPAGAEELHLLAAVGPLVGEGVDGKLLVARAANGGVQVVVVAGTGRIGKEAAHILLETHGTDPLPVAESLPLAVGAGEEPVHVLLHLPQPEVHRRRIAKQEQHPMAGAQLAREQTAQQLVADLDGGGLVAVNTAGEDDILAPSRLAARSAGRLQTDDTGIPDADLRAIRQRKIKGIELPLVAAGHGQKIVLGNHPSHPLALEYYGRIIRKASWLKIIF